VRRHDGNSTEKPVPRRLVPWSFQKRIQRIQVAQSRKVAVARNPAAKPARRVLLVGIEVAMSPATLT